jgi:hypothetical protein
VLKARGGDAPESDPETAQLQHRFERTFNSAKDRAEGARLTRLSEALGLSPEQQATLEVLLANRRDGFRNLQGAGTSRAEMVEQANLAEQRFQEDVKKLLDDEQVAAFDDYRQREKDNDIQARAQRELADLIGLVDLSPAQRDQALAVLQELSTESINKRPPGWSIMSETMDVLGGRQSSAFEEMGDFLDDPAALANPQDFHRKLVESRQAAADAKISRLRSILTPGQLSQYQSTLQARSSFLEQFTPPTANQR